MTALNEQRIADLLHPYLTGVEIGPDLYGNIKRFLDLLLRWNARTNLTAIRDPAQLIQRQIGESVFAAPLLPPDASLLDVGSGAGFPGIPLKLLRPDLQVTLAESQGKKVSFLREASRALGLDVEVWPQRVETMSPDQVFQAVTMRAVDKTNTVMRAAASRVADRGALIRYIAQKEEVTMEGWIVEHDLSVPLSQGRLVALSRSTVFHVEQLPL